jgi:hypothetical protein
MMNTTTHTGHQSLKEFKGTVRPIRAKLGALVSRGTTRYMIAGMRGRTLKAMANPKITTSAPRKLDSSFLFDARVFSKGRSTERKKSLISAG